MGNGVKIQDLPLKSVADDTKILVGGYGDYTALVSSIRTYFLKPSTIYKTTNPAINYANGKLQQLTLSGSATLTANIPLGKYVFLYIPNIDYGNGSTTYTLNYSSFVVANQFVFDQSKPSYILLLNMDGRTLLFGCKDFLTPVAPPALTWSLKSSGIADSLNSVAYGAGLYVIAGAAFSGNTSYIATSTNLTSWTQRTLTGSSILSKVKFFPHNNQFIATGAISTGSTVYTSSDGITWTALSSAGYVGAQAYDIEYANGLYVCLFGSRIRTSPTLATWTERYYNNTTSLESVKYANGLFVAVGSKSNYTLPFIMTSPDGITWTERSVPASSSTYLRCVIHDGTQFLAVGSAGLLIKSTNGTTWTTLPSPATVVLNTIVYQNGVYAIGTSAKKIYTSIDLATWTNIYTASGSQTINGSGAVNSKAILVGNYGFIYAGE